MALRTAIALTFCLLVLLPGGVDAGGGKIPLLDKDEVQQGTAAVNLAKGSVKAKLTLAPLPATVDTGTEIFEATIYKAYLVKSTDEAVEVSLGDVWPNAKSVAKLKVALKGDLSGLGLDRLVVVAFSKDGLHSFDVLTGTLDVP
jgi:hypothetical protein